MKKTVTFFVAVALLFPGSVWAHERLMSSEEKARQLKIGALEQQRAVLALRENVVVKYAIDRDISPLVIEYNLRRAALSAAAGAVLGLFGGVVTLMPIPGDRNFSFEKTQKAAGKTALVLAVVVGGVLYFLTKDEVMEEEKNRLQNMTPEQMSHEHQTIIADLEKVQNQLNVLQTGLHK